MKYLQLIICHKNETYIVHTSIHFNLISTQKCLLYLTAIIFQSLPAVGLLRYFHQKSDNYSCIVNKSTYMYMQQSLPTVGLTILFINIDVSPKQFLINSSLYYDVEGCKQFIAYKEGSKVQFSFYNVLSFQQKECFGG